MNTAIEQQSTGELIKHLRDDATKLVVQHIDLARVETVKFVDDHIDNIKKELIETKQEMAASFKEAARNAAYLSAGSIILYTSFVFLLIAAATGINAAFLPDELIAISTYSWAGPLIVGAATALAGYVMMHKAKKYFADETEESTITHSKEKQKWMPKQMPSKAI